MHCIWIFVLRRMGVKTELGFKVNEFNNQLSMENAVETSMIAK